MSRPGAADEKRVWDLLTRDFVWQVPAEFPVKVHEVSGPSEDSAKLQVFEIAVAAIFAHLRPDYEWYVTARRPDDGLDFLGRHAFLRDETLGIAAAVTVGGQCKKRTRVDNVVDELAGDLINMAAAFHPTFFVVAFSAHLDRGRVEAAQARIESQLQRHCHILDRRQVEGLIRSHLVIVHEILREALLPNEVDAVVDYFRGLATTPPSHTVTSTMPGRVLAGVSFRVVVHIRSTLTSEPGLRVRWQPKRPAGATGTVILIGPVGADTDRGAAPASDGSWEDPVYVRCSLEFVSYAVGQVDLGEVTVGHDAGGKFLPAARVTLGSTHVVENLHPRFFDRPFRAGLIRLDDEFERAMAAGTAAVGVTGGGGSGKSRMCEEFCLEKRRRGAKVLVARQTKTLDDPHRVLAELLAGLAQEDVSPTDPAAGVIRAIARYDPVLAGNAEPAIRSIFGTGESSKAASDEQSILSALIVLLLARQSRAPLVVHLQDLHWCTAEVLLLLERLLWQLSMVSIDGVEGSDASAGTLFIFEGRVREAQTASGEGWTSASFEAFLEKLDCPTVTCSHFSPDDGLRFIRLLFEDRHSSHRLIDERLIELQNELIDRIGRTSGGNPFHSLEQVRMLKERGSLGQNRDTGLLYMIHAEPADVVLPDSVFESVRLRWEYLKARSPDLALLVWGAALLEDRLEMGLFRRLHSEIAPHVATRDIDATDLLWTGEEGTGDVVFRHENYFHSLRRFDVPRSDRERVIDLYSDWFASSRDLDAVDRFRWGRVLLEHPDPDTPRAQALLKEALQEVRRRGDAPLARRIATASLDLSWEDDARAALPTATFLRLCDEELDLTRGLLASDRLKAAHRLARVQSRIKARLGNVRVRSAQHTDELWKRRLIAEIVESEILFNDRQPTAAASLAGKAVREIQALRPGAKDENTAAWEALEMEALHSHAVAMALSGEIDSALETSERAVTLATQLALPRGRHVVSTHANILLARNPAAAESMLRICLADVDAERPSEETWSDVKINLAMALVLRAYGMGAAGDPARPLLNEASELLTDVFGASFRLGEHPDAGAAALMLGVVSALRADEADASWFGQAVVSAARGRQMETLWRAHCNLAGSLLDRDGAVTPIVRDQSVSALQIMQETLSPYPEPDRSPRFRLLAVPLAQTVRVLILADDDAGVSFLEQYPALRACFEDVGSGVLRDDRGGYGSHEWLRVGAWDYVIY